MEMKITVPVVENIETILRMNICFVVIVWAFFLFISNIDCIDCSPVSLMQDMCIHCPQSTCFTGE